MRIVFYESILEKNFLLLICLRDDLVDLQEQPTAVPYVDAQGRQRHHVFDVVVTLADGTTIAVAIKPKEKVLKYNFERELEYVAASTPKSFATKIKLITDLDLDAKAAQEAARKLMMQNRSMMELAA